MKKIKHVFTRIIENEGFITKMQNFIYLPESAEEKIKVMGQDYTLGNVYKRTWSDGYVEMGFDHHDYGNYRPALPGEKIKKVVKYDYFGNEIKGRKK